MALEVQRTQAAPAGGGARCCPGIAGRPPVPPPSLLDAMRRVSILTRHVCTRDSLAGRHRLFASAMASQDELKKQAGYKAVDDYVRSGMKIGLGTGSTAYFAVERVGQLLASGALTDIVAVRPGARGPSARVAHRHFQHLSGFCTAG